MFGYNSYIDDSDHPSIYKGDPMAGGTPVQLTVVFVNQAAIDALAHASDLITSLSEDMPWKDELSEALKSINYACDNIDCIADEELMDDEIIGEVELVDMQPESIWLWDDEDDMDWLGPSDN